MKKKIATCVKYVKIVNRKILHWYLRQGEREVCSGILSFLFYLLSIYVHLSKKKKRE